MAIKAKKTTGRIKREATKKAGISPEQRKANMQKMAEARAAAQAAKRAEREAAQDKALKLMDKRVARINAALANAAKSDKRADDLRVTAACELGAAKAEAESAKVNFKEWCEKNIDMTAPGNSYENIRKLAALGYDKGADEVALALADMRTKNKEANKKLRDKKKGETKQLSGPSKRKESPSEVVLDAFDHIKDQSEARNLVKSLADSLNVKLDKKATEKAMSLDGLKATIRGLSAKDREKLFDWMADEFGFLEDVEPEEAEDDFEDDEGVDEDQDEDTDDAFDIPENLRR